VAFGELTLAVDTHVFRVANRTGLAPGKDPLEVETKLMRIVPAKHLRNAHHYLILHGRYTCLAKKPLCHKCPVFAQCGFKDKRKYSEDPAKAQPRRGQTRLPK
jgi:endonuclease-3